MKSAKSDSAFVLVEVLVALSLATVLATVVLSVSRVQLAMERRLLDQSAAWANLESLGTELRLFGKHAPCISDGLSDGYFTYRCTEAHDLNQATYGNLRLWRIVVGRPGTTNQTVAETTVLVSH